MPYYEIPKDETTAARIEKIEERERIVSVVPHGPGALLVFTEPRGERKAPGAKERRS